VGLDVTVAVEDAVEDNIGPLFARAGGNVEDVVASGCAAVDEDLCAVNGKVSGLGGSLDGNALCDVYSVYGDASGVLTDAYSLSGVDNTELSSVAFICMALKCRSESVDFNAGAIRRRFSTPT
jgi:hypothetical protein